MQLETLYQDYIAAWRAHDVDAVLSFFAHDGVYEDVALGTVSRSAAEVREFVQASLTAIPDIIVEPKRVFATADRLCSEWTMSGTHAGDFPGLPATGRRFSVEVASIIEWEDGKIRRNTDYWNLASFLQQITS